MQQSIASFFCPTKIFLGESSYQKLKDILRGSNYRRLFIAVDGALLSSDFYQRILALLKELEVESASFSDIEPDPSVHTVNKAFAVCKQLGAQATLALGGGSTIDVAKAVGILMTSGGRIHDYEGIEKFSIAPIPLIAIPTTAGTGSEVSGSCVISDTEKISKCRSGMHCLTLQATRFLILWQSGPCRLTLPRIRALTPLCTLLNRIFR